MMSRRRLPATDAAAARLAAALDDLAGSDPDALDKRWRQLFGGAAPCGLSPALRMRVIAYHLQARALGDLDRTIAQALDRLGRGPENTSHGADGDVAGLPVPDRRGHLPGALLTREWAGALHTVTVLQDGYAWNGDCYDSLSAVAGAITGTRWNGPRFFGLRERAKAPRQPDAANVPSGRSVRRPAA